MAVRYRKYFKECKPIQCTGRRSRQCPETLSGQTVSIRPVVCGALSFLMIISSGSLLLFKDIRNKSDAEKRLTLFISDRERGQLNLPKKKAIPKLAEYSKTYLELYKTAKERTLASKKSLVSALVRYLGNYRLDRVSPFIIERFRIDCKEKRRSWRGNDKQLCGYVIPFI